MSYEIRTKIVGVSFNNEDGSNRQELIKQLNEGDILTIKHEPENKYDSNSHIIKHNDKIIGHLKKELAESIVKKVKSGEKILKISDWKKTGQEKHTLGVNIVIEMQGDGKNV